MSKARGLVPWIMGGLMIAAIAAAIAVGSAHRDVTAKLPAPAPVEIAVPLRPAGAPARPAPPAGPESAPPTVTAVAPGGAAQAQTEVQPVTSGAQIWECTIEGVKTFSGKPCGAKSSLREISAVNGMDPTPALSVRYEPESRYPPDYSYPEDQEPPRPPVQEVVRSSPVFIGIPIRERRRPEHAHRPVHGPYRAPPIPKN